MFKNQLKVAFRYLKNHKSFAFINIIGLTLGFFCFFLLNSYVLKETSFDKDQENVYRLLEKKVQENGTVRETAQIGPKVGAEAKRMFPEIKDHTQIFLMGRRNIGNNPETVIHQDIAILDTNFLKVFDFPILEGTFDELSNNPNGLILTKSTKEFYFGQEPALGKTLKMGEKPYPIVGVLDDFPQNSHLENLVFISSQMASGIYAWLDGFMSTSWANNQLITYFKIAPNANIQQLEEKITNLVKENYPEGLGFNSTFLVQPVQEIHLYENEVEGEMNKAKGNGLYVNLFFWVGILILLVACFNYAGLLNIAFIDRFKEIALRQIVGAGKLALLRQFLSESLLLISISMALAYMLLWLLQPLVQKWFSTTLDLTQIPLIGLLVIMITGLVLGLLSVTYPFWAIIRTGISLSLKNTVSGGSKLPFRKLMLTFQFIAVIVFITSSLVFDKQMNFLERKELGFEKEGLATIDINSRILRSQFQAIKNEFSRIPEVIDVTVSSRVPGEWKNIPVVKAKQNGQQNSAANDMLFFGVDENFLKTYDITLLEGINFDGTPNDSTKILINKTAALTLGLEEPLGRFIEVPSWNIGGSSANLSEPFIGQITGIVEDFQIEDFKTVIKPLIIANWNNPIHSIDYYTLRIKTSDWASTLAALGKVNDSFDPNAPMELNILDEKLARFFEKDLEHFRLLNFFSIIIIFLACMGLFATSSFVARSRAKEIGIRKVLGSSVPQLLYLLSQDFVRLVLIGLVIAIPIAWFLLARWLSGFAYRIEFAWLEIFFAGIICLFLTLITVSFQSIKAAIVNPVKSLRTE